VKLFISWSGERSKAMALALKDWCPLVLHYVEPWLSEADIEAGQRWADAVAKELESCNFGILCITRENLNSPWILFEAGALAKSLEGSRVIPLLLDLDYREIGGPIAQFQAKKVEKTGLLETIQSINQQCTQPIAEDRYKQLFEALWPDLESKISSIPKSPSTVKHSRPQADILEELVGAVRTMETRFRDLPEAEQRPRRQLKHHPMMLHHIGQMLSEKPGDPINLLIAASTFRDSAPWLYELGMEAYRANTASGNSTASRKSIRKFMRAFELLDHGPFPPEELGIDSRTSRRFVRELEHMIMEVDMNTHKQQKVEKKVE